LVFGKEVTKCEGKELLTKYGTHYVIERVSDEDYVLDSEELEVLNIDPKAFYDINEQEPQERLRYDTLKSAVNDAIKKT
jgi:hypothetical protein